MNVINIEIKTKIAKTTSDVQYVCGNSDYLIRFSFDDEWDQYETKTARIVNGDGEYHDVVFTGCECDMPIISNAYAIKIGVFAGNLHTTTPAYVPAVKSILCGAGTPADPPEDVYAQIMEMLNAGGGEVTDEQIAQAVSKYLEENPIAGVTPEEVLVAVDAALEAAKDSGEFDGEDGKTPVRGVDYWTEADREQIVGEVLGEVGGECGDAPIVTLVSSDSAVYTYITKADDGDDIALSAAIVEVNTTAAEASRNGTVRFFANDDTLLGGSYITGMCNTAERTSKAFAVPLCGRWFSLGLGAAQNSGNSGTISNYPIANMAITARKRIAKVEVYCANGLPVGSEIKVWGVRANA